MKSNDLLDSFNKDKIKCKKCKEYFDPPSNCIGYLSDGLCEYCAEKWNIFKISKFLNAYNVDVHKCFDDWCNK